MGANSMGRGAHGRTAAPPGGGGRALNGTLPAGVAVNAHGDVSLSLNLRRLAELDLRRVTVASAGSWEAFACEQFFRIAARSHRCPPPSLNRFVGCICVKVASRSGPPLS